MEDLTVTQAKRFGIFSCTADMTLLQAAQHLVQEDISGLVVVDNEGFLAGIITRTDILRAFQENLEWRNMRVDEMMNTEVITVSPQDKLDHVIQLLIERQIHRVVISEIENGRQRPLGVISDADLLYHMIRSL